MTQREPNPGGPEPEITFLHYLRNSRLGRTFARTFTGSGDKMSANGNQTEAEGLQDVKGGSTGFLGRYRKAMANGGLGSLLRRSGKGPAAEGATQAPGGPGPAQPDGSEPPQEPVPAAHIESVGAVLRRTREDYNEDLSAVAQTLHIRLTYLQAIEEERFDRLPGHAYAVGFIRAYSDYLGLDSAEMVRRFKVEVQGLDKRQELFFPVPVSESKVPGGAIILVSLLFVGIAYGAWFYLTSDERPVAEAVPPVPEELGGPPAEQAVAGTSEEGDASPPVETAAMGEASADEEGGEASEESAAAEPAEAAEPAAASEPEAQVAEAEANSPEQETAASEAQGGSGGETEQGSTTGETISAAIAQSVAQTAEAGSATSATEAPAAPAAPSETAGGAEQASATATDEPRPGSEEAAAQANAVSLARILRRPSDLVPPQPPQVAQGQRGVDTGIPEQAGAGRGNARQPLPGSPGIVVPSPEEGAIPRAPATEQLVARTEGRTPQTFGAENEATRIVLRATQDSWVQVRDGNDNLVMTRVLRRGDEYRVPDQSGLTLITGNAGGIEIVVDGAALSPLGPVGAVRRNIQLDPERLLEGTAIPSR